MADKRTFRARVNNKFWVEDFRYSKHKECLNFAEVSLTLHEEDGVNLDIEKIKLLKEVYPDLDVFERKIWNQLLTNSELRELI